MRQPDLTSLIGLRDSDGDRLFLLRSDRPNGTRGYMLRVGTGSVFLTAGRSGRVEHRHPVGAVLGEPVPILRPGHLAFDLVRTGVVPDICSHRAIVCAPLVAESLVSRGDGSVCTKCSIAWTGASQGRPPMCSDGGERAVLRRAQLRHDLGEVTGVSVRAVPCPGR